MTKEFDSLIKDLSGLVENNNHGEALLRGAKFFDDKQLVSSIEKINRNQNRIGYLSYEDSQSRHALYEKLMAKAKRAFSEVQFKKFYMCF